MFKKERGEFGVHDSRFSSFVKGEEETDEGSEQVFLN